MTYEFEYLMHLFACGSLGAKVMPPRRPVDFDRLCRLAQEHSVLPLAGAALCDAPDMGFPADKVRELVKNTRAQALSNYARRRLVLKLLADFETAGIRAVLLKGYSAADLYAQPDCRVSCDTDIYVDKQDEKRACQLLREHGCTVRPRTSTSAHAACEHLQMGHIELHAILYDEVVKDVWFGRIREEQIIREPYERHAGEDGAYLKLGKTDQAIFLALHMAKHFIRSGASLRQMMDIALHLKEYRSHMDAKRFWDTLKAMRYDKLLGTALGAMIVYCGFSPDDFPGLDEAGGAAVSAYLDDLEAGGWLGKKEGKQRVEASFKYHRTRFTQTRTPLAYWAHVARHNAARWFRMVFPQRHYLVEKYPFAKGSAWRTALAWVRHSADGVYKLLHGRTEVTSLGVRKDRVSADENDRSRLYKMLGMM